MYFTIRIIRFFVRLCLKIVLLPITVVRLLVGATGSTDDYDFDPGGSVDGGGGGDPVDPAVADDSRGGGAMERGTAGTDATGGGSAASATARTNAERFRKSFYVVGALHVLFAVGIAVVGFDDPYTDTGGVAWTMVLIGLVPVAIGAALPRWPKPAWYAGMGYVGLSILSSIVTIPVGLLTMVIYGVIGYFGWNGRSAVRGASGPDVSVSRGTETGAAVETERAASNERSDSATASAVAQSDADGTGDASSAERSGTSPTATAAPDAGADTEAETAASETQPQSPTTGARSEAAAEATAAPVPAGRGGDRTGGHDEPSAAAEESAEEPSEQSDASDVTTGDPIAEYRDGLNDADPATRQATIEDVTDAVAAGDVPVEAAIDALVERLESDANADVRAAACAALGELGTDRARGSLADYRLDPDSDVSRAASRALRTIDRSE